MAVQRPRPPPTFTSSAAVLLLSSQTGQQFGAAGPGLSQRGVHVLGQPVVLHQLAVDPPPGHLVLHEASLHHGAQLLLLGHLALQAGHLLAALRRRASASGESVSQQDQGGTFTAICCWWNVEHKIKVFLMVG